MNKRVRGVTKVAYYIYVTIIVSYSLETGEL